MIRKWEGKILRESGKNKTMKHTYKKGMEVETKEVRESAGRGRNQGRAKYDIIYIHINT